MLSLALADYTSAPPYSYNITGKPITLDGFTVSSDATSGGAFAQGASVQLPITLGQSQTWALGLDNFANLNLGPITGSTDSLTVSATTTGPSAGGFVGFSKAAEVGPLTFSTPTGNRPDIIVPSKSLNGIDGNSVTFDHSGLFATGPFNPTTVTQATIKYGPPGFIGTNVQLGNGGGTGPYGLDKVNGALTFDSTSFLTLFSLEPGTGTSPVAGLSYPQLSASGSVALGSAGLSLWAGCNQTVGTKYTIVRSGIGLTGQFAGVANNAVVPGNADNEASCTAPGAVAPMFKIHYGLKAVTATVVAAVAAASPNQAQSAGRYWAVSSNGFLKSLSIQK